MSEKSEKAKKFFLCGYNCSQAVAGAFCNELGLPFDIAVRISSGFGGGIGRMREVCGAFTGAVMVLSIKNGYTDCKDTEGKKELYKLINEFASECKAVNGSIVCNELLSGIKKTDGSEPEERSAEYYRKRPCSEIVENTAMILEKYIK